MQKLPMAATSHLKTQRRESQAALTALDREWSRIGPEFDAGWAAISGTVYAIMATAQKRIADESIGYVPEILESTGQESKIPTDVGFRSEPYVGVTGTGVRVDEALFAAVITAKVGVRDGASVPGALELGRNRFMAGAQMALADSGRLAERVAFAPRKIAYYQRALSLPSCSRCVILAGRLYRVEQAFQRHPQCDCRHLPVGETAEVEALDPLEYFASLTDAEQNHTFGKAGAEAIRNGADINQVVNANRGMYTSRSGGRTWKFTSEGTTRRGWWGRDQSGHDKITGERTRVSKRRRLMPEEIQRLSSDKDDYLRMLRDYGFII